MTQQLFAQGLDGGEVFSKALDSFVEHTLEKWHVPGLSIAVVNGEKTFSKVKIPEASPLLITRKTNEYSTINTRVTAMQFYRINQQHRRRNGLQAVPPKHLLQQR